MLKIGIIGTGHFGAALTEEIYRTYKGVEIRVVNRTRLRSMALADELSKFNSIRMHKDPNKIRAARSLTELRDCDIIAVCVKERYQYSMIYRQVLSKNNSRLREYALSLDVPLVREIASSLKNYSGIVLMCTNPVELMCSIWVTHSGCDPQRVLGLGLSLDAARSERSITDKIHDARVKLVVLGLHGPQGFIAERASYLNNITVERFTQSSNLNPSKIIRSVNSEAVRRVLQHGYTSFEPAFVFARDLKRFLSGHVINASGARMDEKYLIGTVFVGGLFKICESKKIARLKIDMSPKDHKNERLSISYVKDLISKAKKWHKIEMPRSRKNRC